MSTARIDRSTTSFEENQCIESPTLTSSAAAPPPPPKPKVDGQADKTERWTESFQQAGLLGGVGRQVMEKAGAREKLAGLKDGQTETLKLEQAIPLGVVGLAMEQEVEVTKKNDGFHFSLKQKAGMAATAKLSQSVEGRVEFHTKTLDEATELVKRFGEVAANQLGGPLTAGSFGADVLLTRFMLDPKIFAHVESAEISGELAAKLKEGEKDWAALGIEASLKGKASVTYRLERSESGDLEVVQRLTAKLKGEGEGGFKLPSLEGGMSMPTGLEQTLGPVLKLARGGGEAEAKVSFEVRAKVLSSEVPKIGMKVSMEGKLSSPLIGRGGAVEISTKLSAGNAALAAAEIGGGNLTGAMRFAEDVTIKAQTYNVTKVSSGIGSEALGLEFGGERESKQLTSDVSVRLTDSQALAVALRLMTGK